MTEKDWDDLFAEIGGLSSAGQPVYLSIDCDGEALSHAQFLGVQMGMLIVYHACTQRELPMLAIKECKVMAG